MSGLEKRTEYIGRIEEFARGCSGASAMLVLGDGDTKETGINVAVVVREQESSKVFARLNYLISSELQPESSNTLRRDEAVVLKEFTLPEEYTLALLVCPPDELIDAPWWRCVFDLDGDASRVMGEQSRVDEDRLADPAAEIQGDFDEEFDFNDGIDIVEDPDSEPEPKPEPEPEPQPADEPEQQPESDEAREQAEAEEYWRFVAANLKAAKRAIASESYIRASETVNMLRKMLIELICVRSGISENFEHAIDFIDTEEKRMLIKTYPVRLDAGCLAAALAVESELFDRLA